MKVRRNAALQLCLVVACVVPIVSCTSSQTLDEGLTVADTARKTQQQVQSELMAFSDRFFAETLEMTTTLEQVLETPESRYTAAAGRLVALMVTTDIAASPNPGAALLDMTVFVTLKRMVWEDYWMPEVYGDEAGGVLDSFNDLEEDIWAIASGVYTPEQLTELRELIADWRAQHPDVIYVDFMRLAEFGDSKQVDLLINASRPGGMLAPVREANRSIEEMRLLAERLAFMATRMQLMISLQVEMATAKLAYQPEVQQLLEDSRTFAEVSDRAAEAFATLVADLPEERRAAVDQIMNGLSEQREQILADLGNEDGNLRPALDDVRRTLEVGREMADVLGEAIRATNALVESVNEGSKNASRPFDILDYQTAFGEATIAAREIQQAATTLEHLLESGGIAKQMDQVVDGANRLEDEVVDEIVDHAFLRGVALIVVFFVFLTLYRLLISRLLPGPGSVGKPRE